MPDCSIEDLKQIAIPCSLRNAADIRLRLSTESNRIILHTRGLSLADVYVYALTAWAGIVVGFAIIAYGFYLGKGLAAGLAVIGGGVAFATALIGVLAGNQRLSDPKTILVAVDGQLFLTCDLSSGIPAASASLYHITIRFWDAEADYHQLVLLSADGGRDLVCFSHNSMRGAAERFAASAGIPFASTGLKGRRSISLQEWADFASEGDVMVHVG